MRGFVVAAGTVSHEAAEQPYPLPRRGRRPRQTGPILEAQATRVDLIMMGVRPAGVTA
jgi:hypothetical protein